MVVKPAIKTVLLVTAVHTTLHARLCHCFFTPSTLLSARAVHTKPDKPAACTMADYALVCNGEETPCTVNSEELLKTFPRGPYTTARTHLLNNVFEFEFHNRRIAESTRLMVEAGTLHRPEGYDMLAEAASLRPLHLESVQKAVNLFRARSQGPDSGEAKLTTLLTVGDDSKHKLYVHCQPLGTRPGQPVKIQVMGAPRMNALAKDSGWVTDRQGLWDARAENVHEVVLNNETGHVFEGLSSNFFAIVRKADGTPVVQTAGEGVLLGTVRELALSVCKDLGVEVDENPPLLKDMDSWEECFISSTSRWVLPVGEVILADGTSWKPPSNKITNKIYAAVLAHALENSTPVELAAAPVS